MHSIRRRGSRVTARGARALVAALAIGAIASSCGGGGGDSGAAKPMVLVEFLFVDRGLEPSFPTGVLALPRNALVVFQFSELVDPSSVNNQTIAIRYGAQFQSIPRGSFSIDGSRVIFDPTVTQQGTPNPFGLDPLTQYQVELPSVADSNDAVENLDDDPLLTRFLANFTTSDGYLRELEPPSIESIAFIPGQDPFTKQVKGDSIISFTFSEAMDPASFIQSVGTAAQLTDTIDVRYRNLSPNPNGNNPTALAVGGVEGVTIPGTFIHDPSARIYYFKPLFSFGSALTNYDFAIQVFQGLKDLSGNALVNPKSFGPYICDGTGIPVGKTLTEGFDTNVDKDTTPGRTTADWGVTVPSELDGAAITTKVAYIAGWRETLKTLKGKYKSALDPLIGSKINLTMTGINPPSSMGRRTMYAFDDGDVGQSGTITDIAWGPDSNQTFAAKYPSLIIRLGYQKSSTLSLSQTFSSNYAGSPLIVYQGAYDVAQKTDVGNVDLPPSQYLPAALGGTAPFTNPVQNAPCPQGVPPNGELQCLFNYSGYYPYPKLTSNFDWDEGDPLVTGDSILLLDVSVQEGDTWQQIRTWFGYASPASTNLIPGYPKRRLLSTYEQDGMNPPENVLANVFNPEPAICDTALTLTKRVSLAQSRFYTPLVGDPGGPYPGGVDASAQTTYGTKSDYFPAVITPEVQKGGATVLIEYQGCTAIQTGSNRATLNAAMTSTPWTTNVNDCDRYPYLRWRLTLTSNLASGAVPKITSVVIPIQQLP